MASDSECRLREASVTHASVRSSSPRKANQNPPQSVCELDALSELIRNRPGSKEDVHLSVNASRTTLAIFDSEITSSLLIPRAALSPPCTQMLERTSERMSGRTDGRTEGRKEGWSTFVDMNRRSKSWSERPPVVGR